MKNKSFYKFLMFAFIVAGIYSCNDMMDVHQEYIKNGEIKYLTKMDSVVVHSGKNRVQLSGVLKNAYNVNQVRVSWNQKADSITFDYTKVNNRDSLNLIIPNLKEGSYLFKVYTINNQGNRSVEIPLSGTVYGDIYQATLGDRLYINQPTLSRTGKLTINWLSPVDNSVGCEMSYTNFNGIVVKRIVPNSETLTEATDMASDLKLRTLFLPEEDAVDTFYTAWKNIEPSSIKRYSKVMLGGWDSNYASCMDAETGNPMGGLGGRSEEEKKAIDIYFEDAKLGCTDLDSMLFDNGSRLHDTGTRYAKTNFTASDFYNMKSDNSFKNMSATLKEIGVHVGDVVFFITKEGNKGLLRVVAMSDPRGDLTLDEIIQP
ncbi:MAG: DUF4998 domain-containing protein [Bacteroidota bacterium]|nr:DUF4998 domain-containing protein [Bacteroidota bacterium]MDP4204540.1 DUF4998 domain-containing protein [Bacteroidota bacterium]